MHNIKPQQHNLYCYIPTVHAYHTYILLRIARICCIENLIMMYSSFTVQLSSGVVLKIKHNNDKWNQEFIIALWWG